MTPVGGGLAEQVDVAADWPHCTDYGALLEAITELEKSERAVGDAREEAAAASSAVADSTTPDSEAEQRLQDARIALRDAEAKLLSAVRAYETTAVSAVASAEDGLADTSADDEARGAAGHAIDAFAAVIDAARFAAFAETSAPLNTSTYDAAYESALAAAWEQADAGRVTAELRITAAEDALEEAERALEEAQNALEEAQAQAQEVATAAREAAAAARDEAEMRAASLDAVATIARSFGDSDNFDTAIAYQAARQAAYNEAYDTYGHGRWAYGPEIASLIANLAARDGAYAAQAGLAVRLDRMAEQAGFDVDIQGAHEAAMSAWIEAWTLAEAPDWKRRFDASSPNPGDADHAFATVFDRQPAYDDLAYRAAARAMRTAAAGSVPPSESVAVAEAEDLHWAEGGAAHRAFVAARDRIASVRVGYRGLIHPGTDLIAWNALHVALDLLVSSAQAEAAEIREAAAAPLTGEIAPEVDHTQVFAAETAVTAAQAELSDALAALDVTRPNYDLAVRAAWPAVAAETRCT